MRTGEARCRAAARGFTYLLLLLAIAIGSAGLAALGTQWRTALQRERETELIFRGDAIAAAIAAYRHAQPDLPQWPHSFDDLLDDRRGPAPRRHLRRIYTDPFTGRADWLRTPTEDGGFRGVRSRSEAPAFITHDMDADTGPGPRRISQRHFGLSADGALDGQRPGAAPTDPHGAAPAPEP
jgi:type II secretory pathway pseudopilin PulG